MARDLTLYSCLAIGIAACSGQTPSASTFDSGGVDSFVARDISPDAARQLSCDGDCTDYAFTRLILPSTPQQQQQFGIDFDGDDDKDNQLGGIVAGLHSLVDLDLQQEVDLSVTKGDALLIARLKASSFDNATDSHLQVWLAEEADCCPNADNLADCQTAAATTCFASNSVHRPGPNSPDNMLFAAQIKDSRLLTGPARLTIRLSFSGATPTDLDLDNARIQSTVNASGMTSGIIAGTISQQMLEESLITALAETLISRVDNGGETANIIKTLFDVDKDGTVSLDEIKNDDLMKSLFTPDVDVDKDGTKEMSLGLGFEAIVSQIAL